jgi:glutamate synthase (NADPH/NADH) small chain
VEREVLHLDSVLGDNQEMRKGIPSFEAARQEAMRCLDCPDPTCMRGCPAHNDIPGFIRAVREGDLSRAHSILRNTSFLPDVCSRVCDQSAQCEGSCSWSLAGEKPVAIGLIERFITDNEPVPPLERLSDDGEGMSVAVVGAGPAGIGAASTLVQAGVSVTVFEKDEDLGGLLRWGIPDFTLPDAVAKRPWDTLQAAGVDLRLGVEVQDGDIDRLIAEMDAVVLCHGASKPIRLPVPGADLDGITDATWFLKKARDALEARTGIEEVGLPGATGTASGTGSGEAAGTNLTGTTHPAKGPRVLVLGAGNTAMDVARSALRLGASQAICVDWLDRRFALVRPDELAEAEAEGVEANFSSTLIEFQGENGRVKRAVLASTVQNDRSKLPKVLKDKVRTVEIDLVVMAMGYRVDAELAKYLPGTPIRKVAKGMPDRRWVASGILHNDASKFCNSNPVGTLSINREMGLMSASLAVRDRVWVAGDALIGPSTVVESMSQGKKAAEAILRSRPSSPARSHLSTGTAGSGTARTGSTGVSTGGSARRVLVVYDSLTGHTEKAASIVAGSLRGRGASVKFLPISRVGLAEMAWADLIVLGTWVEGFVFAGVKPAKTTRAWMEGLPRLGGKRVAVFCTYGVSPKNVSRVLAKVFESKGAKVVATAQLAHSNMEARAIDFATEVREAALTVAAPAS